MQQQLKSGKYRHYKGKYYEVLDIVRHSETLEELVLYKALYESEFGKNTLWVRPKEMFLEEVEIEGRRMKRFELVSEND
jgi:hypothetical protein